MKYTETGKLFIETGRFLTDYLNGEYSKNSGLNQADFEWFESRINLAVSLNSWFTDSNVEFALYSWKEALLEENINKWVEIYKPQLENSRNQKTIGVVMAGNIPMVGFHDLICVLLSGNKFLGKLSSDDKILIPALTEIMSKINPGIKKNIQFSYEQLKGFNAVIATGSNNTARYFEYYFGKYPNIIRKNRNGVGVLSGSESPGEYAQLGKDIFTYFGLGCRNVSKLFVPSQFDFDKMFKSFEAYSDVAVNHKYLNNYDYNKSIYLVNKEDHFDNGFLLLKEDVSFVSPISVVFFEFYNDIDEVNQKINANKNSIQCVVSNIEDVQNAFNLGESQHPLLWDYADGIDTVDFLLNL